MFLILNQLKGWDRRLRKERGRKCWECWIRNWELRKRQKVEKENFRISVCLRILCLHQEKILWWKRTILWVQFNNSNKLFLQSQKSDEPLQNRTNSDFSFIILIYLSFLHICTFSPQKCMQSNKIACAIEFQNNWFNSLTIYIINGLLSAGIRVRSGLAGISVEIQIG